MGKKQNQYAAIGDAIINFQSMVITVNVTTLSIMLQEYQLTINKDIGSMIYD